MSTPSSDDMAEAKALSPLTLNQEAFHQGPPDADPLDRPPPGRFEGRYHMKQDVPPLYCSTGTGMAAMMEQVRHTSLESLSSAPLPVRRLATGAPSCHASFARPAGPRLRQRLGARDLQSRAIAAPR